MRLKNFDNQATISLEGISKLRFYYGHYELFFENAGASAQARSKTGWSDGVDPYISLDIPVDENQHILTYLNGPMAFAGFDLVQATVEDFAPEQNKGL